MKTYLPLLDFISKKLSFVDLEKVLVVCVQHLMSTTFTLFHYLFERGLKPENLFVLGKCYSTDISILNALKQQGVYVHPGSIFFDSYEPYDSLFESIIEQFIKSIADKIHSYDYEKIIVLDDGGHLIQKVYEKWNQFFGKIVAIEQTSSGFHRIKDLNLWFPVLNLARCWAKLEYESPLIIEKILTSTLSYFKTNTDSNQSILILGNGVLGSKIKQSLENKFEVISYDIDPVKSMISITALPSCISQARYIIGCSGNTSLPKGLHCYLEPSTILLSISSSDREFDSAYLRKRLKQNFSCHKDLSINDITLLNSGFPINFKDEFSSADSEDFQLTRSLIFAAITQALSIESNICGLYSLNDYLQKEIINKFLELKSVALAYS